MASKVTAGDGRGDVLVTAVVPGVVGVVVAAVTGGREVDVVADARGGEGSERGQTA
jgi:hypothetical protein